MTAPKQPNIFRDFDNRRIAELLQELMSTNSFGFNERWCKAAIEDLLAESAKRLGETHATG